MNQLAELDSHSQARIRRQADHLARRVSDWAGAVVSVLPSNLPLIQPEKDMLWLYLAQQRRRNLELDGHNGHGWREKLVRLLPPLANGDPALDMHRLVHQHLGSRLEQAIERTVASFCRQLAIPPACEPVIDWRVAIRYMAQQLHRIASQLNLKSTAYLASPLRFELTLTARELSAEVIQKRQVLLEQSKAASSAHPA